MKRALSLSNSKYLWWFPSDSGCVQWTCGGTMLWLPKQVINGETRTSFPLRLMSGPLYTWITKAQCSKRRSSSRAENPPIPSISWEYRNKESSTFSDFEYLWCRKYVVSMLESPLQVINGEIMTFLSSDQRWISRTTVSKGPKLLYSRTTVSKSPKFAIFKDKLAGVMIKFTCSYRTKHKKIPRIVSNNPYHKWQQSQSRCTLNTKNRKKKVKKAALWRLPSLSQANDSLINIDRPGWSCWVYPGAGKKKHDGLPCVLKRHRNVQLSQFSYQNPIQ